MAESTHTFEDNLVAADEALARFAGEPLTHLIAGARAAGASGTTFTNTSPIDGADLGQVAAGDAADIDAAATAAAEAFLSWSTTPGARRKALLHVVADLIVERTHEIAVTECVDTGQTMRFMSAAALRGAENFRFFADQAPGANDGQSLPGRRLRQLHDSPSDRAGRCDHAVEHAIHVEYLEDRPRARRRLHRGAQAGRVVARIRRTCSPRSRLRPASRPGCSTRCTAWARPQARH